ncbi:MAG: RNase adapter RapZ, partial [Synergistaceae bacterium]|nr:RNase adapter RapZ [Synergistaceae bacterium]
MKQFIIVTGMSGAGKTMTLKVLEDFGFITIDNMPPQLLPQLFALISERDNNIKGVVA